MKRILLSIAMCCLSMISMGQKDVTKFLGIPVDGSKSEMIRKLKAKGFSQNPYSGALEGVFNGCNVFIKVITNNDKVCRVMICDAGSMDETNIKNRFNILCKQFSRNSKYYPSGKSYMLKEDERISYEMIVNKKRYEAVYFQMPDTSLSSYKEELQNVIASTYTEEELNNPSKEVLDGIREISSRYEFDKAVNKSVWFMIDRDADEYYIRMFYDNEYNRSHGEDL